jgi:hypothetical protein
MAPVDLPKDSRVRMELGFAGATGLFSTALAGASLKVDQGLHNGALQWRISQYKLGPGDPIYFGTTVLDSLQSIKIRSFGFGGKLGNREGPVNFTAGVGFDYMFTPIARGISYSGELGLTFKRKKSKSFFVYRLEFVEPSEKPLLWESTSSFSNNREYASVLESSRIHQLIFGGAVPIDSSSEAYFATGYGAAKGVYEQGNNSAKNEKSVLGFAMGVRHTF